MSSRTLYLVLAAMIGAVAIAPAQASLGLKGGVSFATLSNKAPDWSSRTGFAGGVAFDLRSGFIGLQPEVLFVQKGVAFDGSPSANTEAPKLGYIDVPILVKITIPTAGIQPMFYAGPSIDFAVSCSFAGTDCSNDFSKTDYGAVLGGGLRFGGDRGFTVEGRYTWGLKDINDPGAGVRQRTRTFLVLVGVSL